VFEFMQLNIPGWLVVGLATGFGPCMGHQFLIILPYLSLTERGPKDSFKEILGFSLARITTYGLLGLASGALGRVFSERITDPRVIDGAQGFLGILLLFLAVMFLLWRENPICRLLEKMKGRAMALAGFFTSFSPCPALLGLLAYSAAIASPLQGVLAGIAFATGTSLSPLLVAGPLWGWVQERFSPGKVKKVIRIVGGLVLFGYGWQLFLRFIF